MTLYQMKCQTAHNGNGSRERFYRLIHRVFMKVYFEVIGKFGKLRAFEEIPGFNRLFGKNCQKSRILECQ